MKNKNFLLYCFGLLFALGGAFLIDLFRPDATLYGVTMFCLGIVALIGAVAKDFHG